VTARSRIAIGWQLLVICLISWGLFFLLWRHAFYDDAARSWWTSLTVSLERTPLLHTEAWVIYQNGGGQTPAPVLIALAPYFPFAGFLAWWLPGTLRAMASTAPASAPAPRSGAVYGLQFTFIVLLLFGDLLFGLPLATGLLGPEILYEPARSLLASSLIIALVSVSILVMMVGGPQAPQAK
jgi:hypothetical protein